MAEQFKSATAPNANALPVVTSIFDFSAEALGELKTWLEGNPPSIPVTQVIGFQQFTPIVASTIGATGFPGETTTSTVYTDLATVGPKLTGLSNGQYLFFFGALALTSAAGNNAIMSIQTDTLPAGDGWAVVTDSLNGTSILGFKTATLSNGNNTVTAKYKSNSGTATAQFLRRVLVGIRYAN